MFCHNLVLAMTWPVLRLSRRGMCFCPVVSCHPALSHVALSCDVMGRAASFLLGTLPGTTDVRRSRSRTEGQLLEHRRAARRERPMEEAYAPRNRMKQGTSTGSSHDQHGKNTMRTGQDMTLPTNQQKLIIDWPVRHSNWVSINTNTGNPKTLLWHGSTQTTPKILALTSYGQGTAARPKESGQAKEADGTSIWELNWEQDETVDKHGIAA